MAIDFFLWDFTKSSYDNVVSNIILKNSLHNRKSKKFKEAFKNVKDGENIGRVNIANWFHKIYGNAKPLCLWDKLMREIERIGTQITDELDRFGSRIEDEYHRVSKRVGNELKREFDDIENFGKKIEDELKKTFKKIEDFIKDPCFITTATLIHLDSYDDDNCYELTLIRKVRDEWLINQPNGKELIEVYKKLAPKIVEKIDGEKIVYEVIWDMFIEPFFILLENGKYDEALDKYILMVNVLKAKYEL